MHSEAILVIVAALIGLPFGSFLNVCIVRLPAGESIISPRSHCLNCHHPVAAFDNIPILSWIWLRGKCRYCDAKISVQYPLIEAATGILFAACVLHSGISWQTLLDAAAVFLLLGLAMVDAASFLLPDAFTLGGLILAIVLKGLQPHLADRAHVVVETIVASAAATIPLLIIRWLYFAVRKREGLGMGDIKLLAMMAAFFGLPLAFLACFLAILAAAIFSLVQLFRAKLQTTEKIPFGSFLAASGIVVLFTGKQILHWYFGFFR